MNNFFPPRVRARTGEGDDKKFYFEISLWNFEGTNSLGDPFCFGPYETESEAKKHMREGVELVVKTLQESAGAEPTGQFIDFKNGGVLRSFNGN